MVTLPCLQLTYTKIDLYSITMIRKLDNLIISNSNWIFVFNYINLVQYKQIIYLNLHDW